MNFNKLSLEEKFGQMLMLSLDTYALNDEIIDIIKEYKIGGVVLYQNNYTSIDTMIEFINKLKEINKNNKVPLFIAIAQENGIVNKFPKDILRMPGADKQSSADILKVNTAINELTTYILDSVGINMNLAPVIDIKNNNKVNQKRSYGEEKDIIKNALPFMNTMKEANIISVVKHFPGHGATNKDSHFTIPKIKDVKSLEERHIPVFQKFIASGADALLVGHLRVKGFGHRPASLNKNIINTYLKDYKGLIITDDLRMNRLKYTYGTKKCIMYSIDAGHDICMFKYKKGDKRLFNNLLKKVKYCEIDPERINDSAKKIINFKKKYNINNEQKWEKIDIELLNKKIRKINDIINKELGEVL